MADNDNEKSGANAESPEENLEQNADDREAADGAGAEAASRDADATLVESAPEAAKPKAKKKKAAAKEAAPSSASSEDEWDSTPEGAISGIFESGPKESTPGDYEKSPLFIEGTIEEVKNPTSFKGFLISIGLVIAAVAIIFGALDSDGRSDFIKLMQGRDIIAEREYAEQMRVEEERRERMENAPRFGTIEILTIPENFLVEAEGLDPEQYASPTMIFQGTRRDLTVPTRSRVVYENIKTDQPFHFTIRGEGVYKDMVVEIPQFRDSDSPWVQDFSGNYSASLTYRMEPLEESYVARELTWRRGFRPTEERNPLTGTITINSEPAGAMIAYNNNLVLDEEGRPALTPHTFSTHPAPANAENQDPRELYLSREGVRIDLHHPEEGKARVALGVYLHQYRCELKEGAEVPAEDAENPDFYDLCNYVYEINVPILDALPEPEPEEGEGEGEGETAEGAAEGEAAEGEGEAAEEGEANE